MKGQVMKQQQLISLIEKYILGDLRFANLFKSYPSKDEHLEKSRKNTGNNPAMNRVHSVVAYINFE